MDIICNASFAYVVTLIILLMFMIMLHPGCLFVRWDSAKITHADRHCHDARVYVYYVDSRMYFYSLQYLLRLAKTADREKVRAL